MVPDIKKGLDGVIIDESTVSKIDGESGDLWYAGYHIDDLVDVSSYEEVLFLLWNQRLPDDTELADVEQGLKRHRDLPPEVDTVIEDIASRGKPMDVVRTSVSLLASYDDNPHSLDAVEDKALRIVASFPTILAYTYRYNNGENVVAPRSDLSHAGNFLYMFHGDEPTQEEVDAFDAALLLYAEHGMNASAFSGVVTISSLSNIYASLTAAIGSLQGPLHGGATKTVIETLNEIGDPNHAEEWVEERIENDDTIPGFGHSVYETTDPRCDHFKTHIESLAGDDATQQFETAHALRDAVTERLGSEGICPNTDLYSGILYDILEIPPEYYTALFGMARSAGWAAHLLEQISDNQLYRPRVAYDGELDREYVPLDER